MVSSSGMCGRSSGSAAADSVVALFVVLDPTLSACHTPSFIARSRTEHEDHSTSDAVQLAFRTLSKLHTSFHEASACAIIEGLG